MTTAITTEDIVVEIDKQVRKLMPEFTGEINLSSSFEDLALDSLSRVDLLAAMEMTYDIEVPDDEIVKVVRVQDLAGLVMSLRSAA